MHLFASAGHQKKTLEHHRCCFPDAHTLPLKLCIHSKCWQHCGGRSSNRINPSTSVDTGQCGFTMQWFTPAVWIYHDGWSSWLIFLLKNRSLNQKWKTTCRHSLLSPANFKMNGLFDIVLFRNNILLSPQWCLWSLGLVNKFEGHIFATLLKECSELATWTLKYNLHYKTCKQE